MCNRLNVLESFCALTVGTDAMVATVGRSERLYGNTGVHVSDDIDYVALRVELHPPLRAHACWLNWASPMSSTPYG